MSPCSAHPSAGWYADPLGTPRQRWWDGAAWTMRVQETAVPRSTDPVAEPAAFDFPPLPLEVMRVDPLPPQVERRLPAAPPLAERVRPLGRDWSAA